MCASTASTSASVEVRPRVKRSALSTVGNLPTHLGRDVLIGVYHIAQKVFKFN